MLSFCTCNLKKNLQNFINDLSLEPYQIYIIKNRFLKEVSLYDKKAKTTEFFYLFLSIFVTIGTIITPAMLSIQGVTLAEDEETNEDYKERIYWFTWITSILITISNGLVQFLNLHKQYISYNSTKEKLLAEGWSYFQLSGKYKKGNHSTNFIKFCEEIEEIKKVQVEKELIFLTDPSNNNKRKEDRTNMLDNNQYNNQNNDNQNNNVNQSRETDLDEEYNVRLEQGKTNLNSVV
jgi:hypothetical protein